MVDFLIQGGQPLPPQGQLPPGGERGRHPAQIPQGFRASSKVSGPGAGRQLASELIPDNSDSPACGKGQWTGLMG